MIDSQKMKHGRMKVMNMTGLLHSLEAKIIRRTIGNSTFDATARQ